MLWNKKIDESHERLIILYPICVEDKPRPLIVRHIGIIVYRQLSQDPIHVSAPHCPRFGE
jgi:hypothetical protein